MNLSELNTEFNGETPEIPAFQSPKPMFRSEKYDLSHSPSNNISMAGKSRNGKNLSLSHTDAYFLSK
jgi:hypothetical protein